MEFSPVPVAHRRDALRCCYTRELPERSIRDLVQDFKVFSALRFLVLVVCQPTDNIRIILQSQLIFMLLTKFCRIIGKI